MTIHATARKWSINLCDSRYVGADAGVDVGGVGPGRGVAVTVTEGGSETEDAVACAVGWEAVSLRLPLHLPRRALELSIT